MCQAVFPVVFFLHAAGEYVVKINAFGRNSDVKVTWDGARKLSELEIETWFEETRRVSRGVKGGGCENRVPYLSSSSPRFEVFDVDASKGGMRWG